MLLYDTNWDSIDRNFDCNEQAQTLHRNMKTMR